MSGKKAFSLYSVSQDNLMKKIKQKQKLTCGYLKF